MNYDPYNNGTPKYSTAQDIYDALDELVQTEEMSILGEIGADVSWDNQTYYYTNKGCELKEEFDKLRDWGNKMWLLDLAILQIDKDEIHGLVYNALINDDLAKRIGFKKLFIEHMLRGHDRYYAQIAEKYLDELGELDRYDTYSMMQAFKRAIQETAIETLLYGVSPYPDFSHYLADKVKNLRMEKETRLIAECRAHLTAYDDFIFGLRANQALYNAQEQRYRNKVAELQATYNEKVKNLLTIAESAGLLPIISNKINELKLIEFDGVRNEGET